MKDEVFGVQQGDDNYCVSVDVVVEGDAKIPLQLRNKKLKVNDVFSQQVPCPKKLVNLNDRLVKLNVKLVCKTPYSYLFQLHLHHI